jgi:hypothetical protein
VTAAVLPRLWLRAAMVIEAAARLQNKTGAIGRLSSSIEV